MSIDQKFLDIQNRTHDNEVQILHSKTCSCLFCRQTYDARLVHDWVNDEQGISAICPECGMDAVVGDNNGEPMDKALLKELNLAFYGEDYMSKHPDAAYKYVKRYREGKITHKKTNEALYVQYLALLSEQGNSEAAFSLGLLYEFGDEFTEKDPKTAFGYYGSPSLRNDGEALARMGMLCASGALGKVDEHSAYEAFAKGMAMGSLKAVIGFSDCYKYGINVNQDEAFAFDLLTTLWGESYHRFILSTGKDINVFPDLCYRLGLAYELGIGTIKDLPTALRFYLISEFAYRLKDNIAESLKEDKDAFADVEARIEEAAKTLNLTRGDPAFDNDTFADSLLSADPDSIFIGRMTMVAPYFTKEDNSFEFDIKYSLPPLIIDIGNLYCGFMPGIVRWRFEDVSDVTMGKNRVFDRITGDPDVGWQFVMGISGSNEPIVSISFLKNKRPDNEKPAESEEEANKA